MTLVVNVAHCSEQVNPDYVLADGSWVEVTLSQNTAYQKLFRYAHQAPRLTVIWLDEDTGLHRRICEGASLPNADVVSVEHFWSKIENHQNGPVLVDRFRVLQRLRGILR